MSHLKLNALLGALLSITLIISNSIFPMPTLSADYAPSKDISVPYQLDGVRIGIQAGHGRGDTGASSCDGTVQEADITAAVAQKAIALLQNYGAQTDLFIGKDPALEGYQADAFIALHTDYCPDPKNPSRPTGYKVSRYGGQRGSGLKGNNDASDQLVQALWDRYGKATGLPKDQSPGHFTNGMLHYYALRQIDPSTPGAIIEMGWLSGDLNELVNEQDKLAQGLTDSIIQFLGQSPEPQPTTPHPSPNSTPASTAQSATLLLVDISGSMEESWRGGIKIDSAKKAAHDVLHMIEQESKIGETDHQISIASFTTDAELNLGLTDDYDAARQAIDTLTPRTRTNIGAGIQVANEALTTAPTDAQKIIILLSDGLTNEGLTPDQILTGPVQQAAEVDTCIYTVGFGEPGDLDENLLHGIAANAACGEYHYASAPSELEQVYIRLRHQSLGTILNEFEGQVAQGETVDIGVVDVPRNQGEMYVTLHWPGSDLDLIITDPRGREVEENDQNANLVKYGNMIYFIIENPRPGDWGFKAFGAEVPEGELTYDAIVSVRERTGSPPSNAGGLLIGLGLVALIAIGLVVLITSGPSPHRAQAGLQMIEKQGERSFIPFQRGTLVIGRAPDCSLVLSDPQVSAHHAQIQRTNWGYTLTDLNSKNGTYVNGQQVQETYLQGGEQLRMGQTEMVFTTQNFQSPAPSQPRQRTERAACLAVMAGGQEFARYQVASGTVLGRYEGCPVDLSSDALVSRQHARLDYQNGQWRITDLESGNHTFVNGQPVRSKLLQHGDDLQMGNTRMRFYAT